MTKENDSQSTPPTKAGLSVDDHTALVDLKFQRAGEAFKAALAGADLIDLSRLVSRALHDCDVAMEGISDVNVNLNWKAIIPAAQAMQFAINDVFERVYPFTKDKSPSVKADADHLYDMLNPRIQKLSSLLQKYGLEFINGDKPGEMARENKLQRKADAAGLTTLSNDEKLKLGKLQIRASEQVLMDGWDGIVAGRGDTPLGRAESTLGEAANLLGNPAFIDDHSFQADVVAMEAVLERVLIQMKATPRASYNHPAAMIGSHLDRLRAYLHQDPKWAAQVQAAATGK